MRVNIEFKADDVTLRGWLFTPDGKTGPFPTVIATHGFAAVKEQSLNEVGETFARAGLAAIVYDHRNHGESDGQPRGHIDPWAQVHDYRHAISFAETLKVVDRNRIGVWGTSYSGAHAIVVAAMDRRVKAGSAQVPMISGMDMLQRQMAGSAWQPLMDSLIEERRAWAKGAEPKRMPIVAKEPGNGAAFGSPRSYAFYFHHEAPTFLNELTLRSIDLTIEYDAAPYLGRLSSTPFQFVIAEDDLATPTDQQLQAYARINGPKELAIIPGDHYTSYLELLPMAAGAAADFFVRHLNRPMWDNATQKTSGNSVTDANVKADIQAAFDQAGKLLNSGASGRDIAKVFWHDELRVVSAERYYPDLDAWLKDFQKFTGQDHAAQFRIVGEPQVSGDLAAVFVHEHEKLPEPADYRLLCVLRKGPKGWRVIMEMWGPGTFDTPLNV